MKKFREISTINKSNNTENNDNNIVKDSKSF